ncbi:MAG: histidine ammonia-lyase [Phycisphaerales bacterium]
MPPGADAPKLCHAVTTSSPVQLDGSPLTPGQVVRVARQGARVELGPAARPGIEASRRAIEGALGDAEPHYGINTGFGSLSRKRIGDEELHELQRNLVRSHAAGVGEPLPEDIVRAMLLILAASLARGRSGVRVELVESIVAMLNAGVTPIVPEIGSVGASGDLAPLSHAALVLIGEGEATHKSERIAGGEALRRAGLKPITLEAKEGLALINGTHLMSARLALIWADLGRVFDAAVIATAMSIDACRGTDEFLDPRVYEARNQPGPAEVAERLRALLAGSQILPSHAENDPRVQDPYSIRCAPIVLGSVSDSLRGVERALVAELGAVTDNPLVFPGADGGDIVSAGNFHGMPLAIPLDTLAIGLAHVAGISERRVYHMLSAFDEEAHLPPYLSPGPGLHSGLMIAQYTAAALCNEIVTLATPASVYNVTTSAGMEDYNSYGPRAAAKAARSLDLTRRVIAIELVCAAQGIEFHRTLRSGAMVEAAIETIRRVVPTLHADRPPSPDIEAVAALIADGAFSPA